MSKKIAAVAALVLAAAGWTGTAQAQSFDDFMTMCGSTDVDEAAVRSAAEKLGWTALPDSLVKTFGEGGDAATPVRPRFIMAAPGDQVGLLTFATTEMPLGGGNAPAQACMLLTQSVGADTAQHRLEALKLGTLREEDGAAGAYMLFSRTANGFRDEGALNDAEDETIAAALRDRQVYLMGFSPGPQTILIKARFSAPGAR